MAENTSILGSIKDALGVTDVTAFDSQIIMHINASLANVTQMGVGPDDGFRITGDTETWADLLGNHESLYAQAKDYIFLSVRTLFDPPSLMSVLNAFKELREEAAWRLNRAREDIKQPYVRRDKSLVLSEITDGSDLDADATRLRCTAGLPFARRIRITNGKEVWLNLGDFEARMHIRSTKSPTSELKYDFSPHLVTAFDGNDITVSWSLTGEQTRLLKPGYFDLVVSDVGSTDSRAIRALYGYLSVDALTTT